MTRRCSHCSHNGHNSRTCPNRGVKLFGVRLTDGFIRKSVSMGNLTHYATSGINGSLQNGVAAAAGDALDHHSAAADGYASEDFVTGSSSSRERKKGTPWTEEEHRMFLLGLQNLGKGDWRGIARNFVVSRTPTQVASHAQKYFIRQANVSRRKRRSSLFDMIPIETIDAHMQARDFLNENIPQPDSDHHDQMSNPAAMDEEGGGESVGSANSNELDPSPSLPENSPVSYPVEYPAFMAPVFPLSTPIWSGKQETHEVFKPRAVHSTSLIKVDELVGMSKLSLGDSIANAQLPPPPSLSLKLVEGSRRQSAFQPNPSSGNSGMNSTNNAIHAL